MRAVPFALALTLALGTASGAAAEPPALDPAVERVVEAPGTPGFVPTASDESAAMARFVDYTLALERRDLPPPMRC